MQRAGIVRQVGSAQTEGSNCPAIREDRRGLVFYWRNQVQLDVRNVTVLDADRLPTAFKTVNEFRRLIGAGRNLFPGEKLIIARRHILESERAVQVGSE